MCERKAERNRSHTSMKECAKTRKGHARANEMQEKTRSPGDFKQLPLMAMTFRISTQLSAAWTSGATRVILP